MIINIDGNPQAITGYAPRPLLNVLSLALQDHRDALSTLTRDILDVEDESTTIEDLLDFSPWFVQGTDTVNAWAMYTDFPAGSELLLTVTSQDGDAVPSQDDTSYVLTIYTQPGNVLGGVYRLRDGRTGVFAEEGMPQLSTAN